MANDTRLFRGGVCRDSWDQRSGFWCIYNGVCSDIAVAPESTGDIVNTTEDYG